MSRAFNKAIYYELTSDSSVLALVSSRVYPAGETPSGVVYPYVTFQRIDQDRASYQGGSSNLLTARYQFDCWAETADEAEAVGDAVAAVLDVTSGTWGSGAYALSVRLCYLETDGMNWEAPSDASQGRPHRVTIDAIVTYRE